MALFTDVGIYGKLPSHGDFLPGAVSEEFVRVWDRWLQECLVASREALADQWLDRYLTGPVWRFACAGGAVGPAPVVGLVAPSVDRVGRYFPLTLVAELQAPEDPLVVAVAAAPFFDAAERLVIDTLAADRVDFERFDSQVSELSTEFASIKLPRRLDFDGTQALVAGSGHERWMLPLQEGAAALGPLFNGLLARHLAELYDPMVIWWTEGSAYVDPRCVVGRGLPDPSGFASMLDSAWTDPNWRTAVPDERIGAGRRCGEQRHLLADLGLCDQLQRSLGPGPRKRSRQLQDRGQEAKSMTTSFTCFRMVARAFRSSSLATSTSPIVLTTRRRKTR